MCKLMAPKQVQFPLLKVVEYYIIIVKQHNAEILFEYICVTLGIGKYYSAGPSGNDWA